MEKTTSTLAENTATPNTVMMYFSFSDTNLLVLKARSNILQTTVSSLRFIKREYFVNGSSVIQRIYEYLFVNLPEDVQFRISI